MLHQMPSLLCLRWHVEGWNIVRGMHYQPSSNWDPSQAGLCKWTLIWESVCLGQSQQCQEELAGKLSLGAKSLWLQRWGTCVGLDVTVTLHFCSWQSSSSVWKSGRKLEICQKINSPWTKLFSPFIALQIQCNGPLFKGYNNANQSNNDQSHLCFSLCFQHIKLAG